ncbi:MAG: hypothetical protein N2043_02020 [Ignavibacterium sp.]|nr:hypothetical protein [Ignavibacterium sp.]
MNLSIYDLTEQYLNSFYEIEEITKEVKVECLQMMKKILLDKWTDKDIIREMNYFLQTNKNKIPMPSFYRWLSNRKNNQTEINLLHPEHYYAHSELQIRPPKPKRTIDYNEGVVKKQTSDYYLEMRSSYTVHDLMKYYLKLFGGITSIKEHRQLKGAFEYLLRFYNVEMLLFMMDVASIEVKEKKVKINGKEPFFIEEYKNEAIEILTEKQNEMLIGGCKVVPRKRKLLGRSRYILSNEKKEYMDS